MRVKGQRVVSSILLCIISLSNASIPISYAAQKSFSSTSSAVSTHHSTTPTLPPAFQQPASGSVIGATPSLLAIGTESPTEAQGALGSASERIPIRVQRLAKRVYRTDENVTVAVTNPSDEVISATVLNAKGQVVGIPVTQTTDGTTTDVQLSPSNEITPGKYTVKITDETGAVTTQDFSWGVLAMNFDKSMYHPGDIADVSMAVLDDQGNMVCDATLKLQITNQALGINDTLSTSATDDKKITVNPQCQHHDFSLQPDYEAQYTFGKAGTYNLQLTATTQNGVHTISDSVQVTDNIPFDVQRVSATRIYPPNTYPMTFNITAHRDFTGTVTETVPQDFVITPATESATPVTSYSNMESVYLNSNDPATQLQQAISASASGGLTMPFQGNYPITQGFGAQLTDPTLQAFYTQYGLAGHDGVDFGVPMDTPLYAVDSGNVIWSGPGDYGITIIIQHKWGETYYGHLSNTAVSVGANVSKGQLIGYSGESGEATGPHLHFGMKPLSPDLQNGYYGKVDPLPYLPYGHQALLATSLGGNSWAGLGSSVLSASTSANASSSANVSVSPTAIPSGLPTATPTLIPSLTGGSQPTTTITESATPPANTNFTVLNKQILTDEKLANSSQTEKVKVITWQVSLKKGGSTSLGYDFQAPYISPQFYLLGPMHFYASGSNKAVFQEQRQWQIASDDVGVEWYQNTTGSKFNGYSWQYRKKIDISSSQVSVTGPTVDFMDSGGDETGIATSAAEQMWSGESNGTGGTVGINDTTSNTGQYSWNFNTGASAQWAQLSKINILQNAGNRISMYVRFNSIPTANMDFIDTEDGGNNWVFLVEITSGGVLQIYNAAGSQLGSNGATLSAGTWYRIDLSYSIISASSYTAKLYVNGTQSISVSNSPSLTNTVSTALLVGVDQSAGNNVVMNVDDIYVDSGTDDSDTGDVHVTAKLPIANGSTQSFTQSGTPTGDTTCTSGTDCEWVNERPADTAAFLNGLRTATVEEFNIQSASTGDVNIAGDTLIADEAWAYASLTTNTSCTGLTMLNNGAYVSVNLSSTTYTMLTSIVNNGSYPTGNNDVGMGTCTNTSGTHTVRYAEGGMQIAYTTSGGSLTNFPVLINLSSDPDLSAHAQSSGNDILFTDSTGRNLLPFEIENYNNATGSLQAWVNISSLSSTSDTIIYMYYGNPSATSQANGTGTWNTNYKGVWHLPTSSGSLTTNDSTSTGNNGTNSGASPTTGQIDGAASFNGTSNYIRMASTYTVSSTSLTISMWLNPTALPPSGYADELFTQRQTAGNGDADFGTDLLSNGTLFFYNSSNAYAQSSECTSTATASTGTWTLYTAVVDSTNAAIYLYVNGIPNTICTLTDPLTNNGSTSLRSGYEFDSGNTQFYSGIIDELEFSNSVRSPGWIATQYNNQNSPGTFYSLGSVETDRYAPTLAELMGHGEWFDSTGTKQPFNF